MLRLTFFWDIGAREACGVSFDASWPPDHEYDHCVVIGGIFFRSLDRRETRVGVITTVWPNTDAAVDCAYIVRSAIPGNIGRG